ncbi:hypothetical protein Y032_0198g1625 [Ancylostoma ceylanicum]|uniref:Uncharacterized protein n=1 Tax=Ancylostoma ceylanicum TaxID=53326 RepID=A0A016SP15_9BILA|nr:hypothetical protein Y032_0198g1625 [Ancylostoma ceylanicum]
MVVLAGSSTKNAKDLSLPIQKHVQLAPFGTCGNLRYSRKRGISYQQNDGAIGNPFSTKETGNLYPRNELVEYISMCSTC